LIRCSNWCVENHSPTAENNQLKRSKYAKSINEMLFSNEVKKQTLDLIKLI
jgi:trans-2-enoyl-CoA reductase